MLSIIIPSHCRADLLRHCLDSVMRHRPPTSEVIVVDDASRDAVVSRAASEFEDVRVIRLRRQRGFCAAVNAGIAAAQGEIVELLNDDTQVTAGWADAAGGWFADPKVASVAPLVLTWPDGQTVDSAGDRYYVGGVAGKRGHGQPLRPDLLEPRPVFGASGSSAFYRRAAVLQVGGFPESFGAYFEDVDLAFRLQRAGYQTMFDPRSRVLHRVSASYGRPNRRLLEQQSCNEERVFWRNLPARAIWSALPHHAGVLVGKAWRRWQEGRLLPFLLGRARVLAEIPAILRHRQALRKLGRAASVAAWRVESRYWDERSPA